MQFVQCADSVAWKSDLAQGKCHLLRTKLKRAKTFPRYGSRAHDDEMSDPRNEGSVSRKRNLNQIFITTSKLHFERITLITDTSTRLMENVHNVTPKGTQHLHILVKYKIILAIFRTLNLVARCVWAIQPVKWAKLRNPVFWGILYFTPWYSR